MAKKPSKRYRKAKEGIDSAERKSLSEGIKTLLATPRAKFDETVELSFNLGVDPRQSDQMVRGTVSLPHGSGKEVKVVVFTENAEEAKAAGAEYAGLDDMIKKVEGGWIDFDVALATSSAMKEVRKLARVLGPRGKMPNPKSGTVSDNIPEAIQLVKAGRVEFKMDKTANMPVVVGKRSFSEDQLSGNIAKAFEVVSAAKPESVKGIFIKNVTLSSTMSPGIKLNTKEIISA